MTFKKILAIAKQNAYEGMYYKYDLLLYIFNFIVEITVYICIWMAIYNINADIQGISAEKMTTYYILVISLNPIIFWGINELIGDSIREGEIQRELLNPISYFNYYFGIRLGELLEGVVVSIITFIISSLIFGVLLPSSILNFILFLAMVSISVISLYMFEIILGLLAFYSGTTWGVEMFKRAIINIFSGAIAPLTLFPEIFQKIANVLPFKDYLYTPINIYFGDISNIEIIQVFIKQGIWVLVLYVLAKFLFNKAIKHITVNGG